VEYAKRDGTRIRHGRIAHLPLEDDDLIVAVTGTGGGFGDPRERDPCLVAADVFDGYIDVAEAREVYAVALDPRTGEIDEQGTVRLREGSD
jgi:N-methylhydantoinase B